MTKIYTLNSMNRISEITDQMKALRLEFDKLINKYDRKSYINTREYYWMLTLRTIGVQISYERAKEIINECVNMSVDFGYKHPYDYLEEDIINIYNQYYK
jgi:hypothetical protein